MNHAYSWLRIILGVVLFLVALTAFAYYFGAAKLAYEDAVEQSAVKRERVENATFEKELKGNEPAVARQKAEEAAKEYEITNLDTMSGYYDGDLNEALYVIILAPLVVTLASALYIPLGE